MTLPVHAVRVRLEDLRVEVQRLLDNEWVGHRVMHAIDSAIADIDALNRRQRRVRLDKP